MNARASSVNAPSVRVHIERLVLHGWPAGFAAGDRARLEAAVVAEVARTLGNTPLAPNLASGGAFASLPGGELRLSAGSSPDAIGTGIAQALCAQLAGGPAERRTYRAH